MVVCLEGFNNELEASQFTFLEPPLWDTAAPGEPAWKLHLIKVYLGSMQSVCITTAIKTPTSTPVLPLPANTTEPSGDITATINLQLMGALE